MIFHSPLRSHDCNCVWQVAQEEAPQSQGGLLNSDDLQIGKAMVPGSGSWLLGTGGWGLLKIFQILRVCLENRDCHLIDIVT